MSAVKSELVLPRAPWEGGRSAMIGAAAAGIIGVALWFISMSWAGQERALYSWLWAFLFWLTSIVGAIGWNCAFQASKARWMILPRRNLEAIGASVAIFAVLFVPIGIWAKKIFPWMHPADFNEEAQRLFTHRHVFMNTGWWWGRAVIYFFIFIVVGERMFRLSVGQDAGTKPLNTAGLFRLGPGALPALGLALTWASFDWYMSLSDTFFSSIFGLYVVAGGAMAAMAIWILLSVATETPMSGNHLHSMGKLMFAFVCFWAYTAFSQFLLQWIADIPDETPWFHMRLYSDWLYVGYFLCIFHFALPFVILLSKELKFMPRRLGFMAVWLLIAHAVDCYWITLPQIDTAGPHPVLSDLFAFVGIGGCVVAFMLFRLRGKMLVPVGDPFLASSLEYRP